jgi:hypothetical protein
MRAAAETVGSWRRSQSRAVLPPGKRRGVVDLQGRAALHVRPGLDRGAPAQLPARAGSGRGARASAPPQPPPGGLHRAAARERRRGHACPPRPGTADPHRSDPALSAETGRDCRTVKGPKPAQIQFDRAWPKRCAAFLIPRSKVRILHGPSVESPLGRAQPVPGVLLRGGRWWNGTPGGRCLLATNIGLAQRSCFAIYTEAAPRAAHRFS